MSACRWRALALSAALLLTTGCSGWKLHSPAWSNATGAAQFERLWWADVKAKEWKEVEYRLAATYVWLSSQGASDREQTLIHLKRLEIEEFSLGDIDVRPNGNDLVITYTISLRGKAAGKPFSLERSPMMTVWQRQKNGWVAIAHSSQEPAL